MNPDPDALPKEEVLPDPGGLRPGPSGSIAVLVALLMVGLVTLVLGLYGGLQLRQMQEETRRDFERHRANLAEQASTALVLPVWNFDREQAGRLADSLMGDATVEGVEVRFKGGSRDPIRRQRGPEPFPRDLIRVFRVIEMDGVPLGELELRFSDRSRAEALARRRAGMLMGIALLDGLVFALCYGLVWFLVLRPVRALEAFARGTGPVDAEARITYRGELLRLRRILEAAFEGLRQRLRAQRESEARFRALFEDSGAVMLILDPLSGRLMDANPAAESYYGWSREALLQRDLGDLTVQPPEGLAALLEAAGRSSRTRRELVQRRADGSPCDVEVFLSALKLGGRPQLYAIVHDISERRQAEAERHALEEQLHHFQRLESIGRLAGGVAHDMNNVLAAILAVTAILERRAGDCRRQVDLIGEACRRGRDLIKGLMDFARKESETLEPLDLNALVRQQAELMASTTLARVQVDLELDPALPTVMGSGSALSTALMNLCVNALDAMPQGGRLRLTTRTRPEGRVEMAVSDTGEGMSPEVRARALEPFFTTKPKGKGTGLGLSIVFGAAKAHGGSVEIDSELGQGTCIRVILPPGRPIAEPSPAPGPLRVGTAALRVLLVDDDELVRETGSLLLEHLGHRVQAFEGGEALLSHLEAGGPADLVMLDLNMPGLDGLATLERMRALRPQLPVVIASGWVEPELRERLGALPGVSFVQKPLFAAEVEAVLAAHGAA